MVCSGYHFFFDYCLRQSPRLFSLKFSLGNHLSAAQWSDTYGIHHWTIIWSSYRKLAWVGFEPTMTEFRSDALTVSAIKPWVKLTLRANFVQLLQLHRLLSVQFHFGYCLHQLPRLFLLKFSWGNHVSAAEWSDTYGIHHRRIIWSSYRKLAWVGFEPTTTEFRSDALTDWAIRPWVRLALRANCIAALISSFVQCQVSFRLLPSTVATFILIEIFLK